MRCGNSDSIHPSLRLSKDGELKNKKSVIGREWKGKGGRKVQRERMVWLGCSWKRRESWVYTRHMEQHRDDDDGGLR